MAPTSQTNPTDGHIVELLMNIPEHIILKESDTPLCDESVDSDADRRTLSAEDDPLTDSSVHLCPDCADEWLDQEDTIIRAPTIQCLCDRIESNEVYQCSQTVDATEARALKHPQAETEFIPVCPDCYNWIKNRKVSSITQTYSDASSWAEISQ